MSRLVYSQAETALQNAFDEQTFNSFINVCVDAARGRVAKFTKEEADKEIRKQLLKVAGLEEGASYQEVHKRFRRPEVRRAIFEVIEEVIDQTLITGFEADPWFNRVVDYRNLALGDKNEFYVPDDTELLVHEVAASNHDIIRQRLGAGKEFSVPVKTFAVKVYMEAERFLSGAESWTDLIAKVVKAFGNKISTMIYEAFMNAGSKIPVAEGLVTTIQPTAANRQDLVDLLIRVGALTGSDPIIMGTKSALAQLQNMKNTDIFAASEKEDIYNMGRIGHFDQYEIIEIPQRFSSDLKTPIYSENKIFILPAVIDKFVKMVEEGGTEIYEVTDRETHRDHTYDYEMVRKLGVDVVIASRFGVVTLSQ